MSGSWKAIGSPIWPQPGLDIFHSAVATNDDEREMNSFIQKLSCRSLFSNFDMKIALGIRIGHYLVYVGQSIFILNMIIYVLSGDNSFLQASDNAFFNVVVVISPGEN